MTIKKGDILYKYHFSNITDKDFCTDELQDKLDEGKIDCSNEKFNPENCQNYSKCWLRPQRAILDKVEITKRTISKWSKDTQYFNAIHTHSKNDKHGVLFKEKIHPGDVDKWSKSESAALRKFNAELKYFIKKLKSNEGGYYYKSNRRNIESFISLQKRIELKIKGLK